MMDFSYCKHSIWLFPSIKRFDSVRFFPSVRISIYLFRVKDKCFSLCDMEKKKKKRLTIKGTKVEKKQQTQD